MALEELLDDGVVLPDLGRLDLAGAREARYVVHSEVTYEYPAPIRALRHRFVVIPRRRHGDQHRITHRLHVDLPRHAALRHRTDGFGNPVVEVHAAEVPVRLSFGVRAVLERSTATGAAHPWTGHHDASTVLTAVDGELSSAARRAAGATGDDPTRTAIAVGEAVHTAMTYQPGATDVRTTAAEAWALGRGVCQDMAHVMIAMCRARGVAARYVSGHLLGDGASHAWVEVRTPTGALAYDPTHARPADLRYVTVAVGRDYGDVAPTAGTYGAGPGGHLTMRKRVAITAVR